MTATKTELMNPSSHFNGQRHHILADIHDRFYLYANAREEFHRYLKYRDKMQTEERALNTNYTYDYLLRRNRERTQLMASLHLAKLYFGEEARVVIGAFAQWDKHHLADKVSDLNCLTMKEYVQWKRSLIQVLWEEMVGTDAALHKK